MTEQGTMPRSQEWLAAFKFDEPISKDDPIWEEYIKESTFFDLNMSEQWRQGLDSILIFVTLLIAILTSFVVETQKQLEVDPVKVSNQILLAIYIHQVQGVATLPGNFTIPEVYKPPAAELQSIIQENTLLFSSLSLCVVTATTATIVRLWVYRYRKSTTMPGPGSAYDRALRRQRAFSGIQVWKLELIIDILPLSMIPAHRYVLVVHLLNGMIYSTYVEKQMRLAGYITAGVFALGLSFLVITQLNGAFIDGCPFQSPLSDMIRWFVDVVLPRAAKRRVIWLCVSCAIILAGTLLITIYTWTPEYLLGFYFAAASLLATQTGAPKLTDRYYALFKDPFLTLFSSFIVFPLIFCAYVKAWCNGRQASPWIMFYLLGALVMIAHFIATKLLAKPTPDNTHAEAMAWLLRCPTGLKKERILTNACRAGQEDDQKALLLSTAFPLLEPVLMSALEEGSIGNSKAEDCLRCLVHLSSFEERKLSILQNQASMVRPELPDELREALERLCSDAPAGSPIQKAASALLAQYDRKDEKAQEKPASPV